MRSEETLVLEAVARFCSGGWRPGENPPDGYLTVDGRSIAVEVSALVQHVTDANGTRPRRSDDATSNRLANELNVELQNHVPAKKRVMLVLLSPILEYRKTKANLASEILSLIEQTPDPSRAQRKISIRGNYIEIYLDEAEEIDYPKIYAGFWHPSASLDVQESITFMLNERITTKSEKCKDIKGPIWLALLSDYPGASGHDYRYSSQAMRLNHLFERILLVWRDGSVDQVYPGIPN